MTYVARKVVEEPRDEEDEYIDALIRTNRLKDDYMSEAQMLKEEQELREFVKIEAESGRIVSVFQPDNFDDGSDCEEEPLHIFSTDSGINVPREREIIRPSKPVVVTRGKASSEDTSSDDEIGGKQGSLSDTPAAVSRKKLPRDKKRKSIVRSPKHISMKKKKMKIYQDIDVASQDKKLIALVSRVIDEKMASFEKLLKNIERNQRLLMLHVTQDKKVSDIVKSDDL